MIRDWKGREKDCDLCARGWRNGGGCPLSDPHDHCDYWPPEDNGKLEWHRTIRPMPEGCRR